METNRKETRRLRLSLWIPIAVAILCIPLATSALPPLPHTFESGQPIRASEINANFEHLESAVAALEASNAELQAANERIESRGAYCNTTAETTGRLTAAGGLVGYAAAAALCATACGSPTAHMCTSEEILRNVRGGVALPVGWYGNGVYSLDNVRYADNSSETYVRNDCDGWTNGTSTYTHGPSWSNNRPSASNCSGAKAVLCCD